MKIVSISEARTQLSKICKEVARTGDPVKITKRGKPLVLMGPVECSGSAVWDARAWLLAERGEFVDDILLPDRGGDTPGFRVRK